MPRSLLRTLVSVARRFHSARREPAPARPAAGASPVEAMESRTLFSGTGLAATYFNNPDFTGSSVSRVDATVNFDWRSNSPAAGIDPYTYSVRWTGKVEPRYSETYTFRTTGNDGVRLWVNGKQLVNDWNSHPATENSGQVTLEAGQRYDIKMEYYQNYGTALAKLEWSSARQARQVVPSTQLYPPGTSAVPPTAPGNGTGLGATYFQGPTFDGARVTRVDSTVNFDWASGSPVAGIDPYTYSVRWLGQVQPRSSETYTFYTTGNDGVRLWVNGQQLVDDWNSHPATENSGRITLQAGELYDIKMEYYQNYGTALAKLEWTSPSQPRQVVPTSQLYNAAPSTVPGPAPDPTPVPDTGTAAPPVAGNWTMVWHDEFDGTTLDPVWRTTQYWDNTRTIVGGGELEAYDASAVSVGGGMLHLTAREEEKYAGTPYVSGLVQTGGYDGVSGEPTFNFKYGYMEVRAKIPTGQGIWPAIWMMPASYNDGDGELDVLEVIGSEPNVANFSLHRGGSHNTDTWTGPDFGQDFHTYGVDWQPDHVSWYVDGVERARMTDPALICPEAMYPILNVAVGGDWPGAPDSTTPFPATMDVDYVRVWKQVA